MYVYKQTEKELWAVGFYDPKGKFLPESSHNIPESAASRVHYLNGGVSIRDLSEIIIENYERGGWR